MNTKLQEIGQKLSITDKDIKDIGKAGFTSKIHHWTITAIIAIMSFILGYHIGAGTCSPVIEGCVNCAGYPYVATELEITPEKRKKSIMYGILISIITFVAGYLVSGLCFSRPVYSVGIKYNIYRKQSHV